MRQRVELTQDAPGRTRDAPHLLGEETVFCYNVKALSHRS
jgi:hypothetical protein